MATETKQATCAERIAQEMADRAAGIAEILERARGKGDLDEGPREEAETELWQYPLSVEVKRMVRIDLSTGGQADWLEATVDSDGNIERLVYHFADWFDHASKYVEDHGDEAALWRFAESFVETALLS
jgi:hypothetical protein